MNSLIIEDLKNSGKQTELNLNIDYEKNIIKNTFDRNNKYEYKIISVHSANLIEMVY